MYSILASLDEAFIHILEQEGININFILRFALLKGKESEIAYFHAENKKNIRLILESSYFVLLNSICKEKHCYLNEYAGELIMEMFLQIISHE
jgi:hypothetical protein